MIEFKLGQDALVLVRFIDFLGTPRLGISASEVSVTLVKSDGSTFSYTPTSPQFTARNTGGFFNSGCYSLVIPAAQVNVLGVLELGAFVNGCQTYVSQYKVIAEENGEIYDAVLVVEGKVDDVQTTVDEIKQVEEGRWKIFTTGGDANRLVFYQADGVTVLKKFDLKDSSGNPTTTNIFERVPV